MTTILHSLLYMKTSLIVTKHIYLLNIVIDNVVNHITPNYEPTIHFDTTINESHTFKSETNPPIKTSTRVKKPLAWLSNFVLNTNTIFNLSEAPTRSSLKLFQ